MSNSNYAIQVEDVAKLYRLGLKEDVHDTLGSTLARILRDPVNNFKKYRSLYNFDDVDFENYNEEETHPDILWALKGVSFDIKIGEVVGIIGTNGAGKSTLLKVLSRITAPTKGQITMRGRISSLLEVGTGFHPELTGRENVYLNGTILGMSKQEIDRKFDEIVEFSGVERFLDTPVKRYSSGMRVRLAFAVAANLEPEILIVDEVLAVGDAEFQKKCINKMQDVGKDGRTVIFVSHSMPAVTRMCERVMLLNKGKILQDGTAHEVVGAYLQGARKSSSQQEWNEEEAPGGEVIRLRAVRLRTESGEISETFDIRKGVAIEMEYEVLQPGYTLMPSFSVINDEGQNIVFSLGQDPEWFRKPRPKGRYISTGYIPGNFLPEGLFSIDATMWTMEPRRQCATCAVCYGTTDSCSA